MSKKNEIIELIKNVPREGSFTVVWDYKNSKSFLELEKLSYELLDIALELLEDDELNLVEKQIVVYAIQGVDFKKYKYFIHDLTISFNNGKIDEYYIDHCFFPRDGWSYAVVRNYRDPIIRESFNICIKSEKTSSNLRNSIRLALRGTLWKNIRKQIIEVRRAKGLAIDDLESPPFSITKCIWMLFFPCIIGIVILIVYWKNKKPIN